MRIFILLSALILSACEGFVHINGTVIDKSTKQPITNATVSCVNSSRFGIPVEPYIIKTDSTGKFEIQSGFIGLVFGSPKFKLKIEKDGYKDKRIKTKRPITIEL